jgi:7,8-dihydropterin-6-yl-methyl-4-(beta-D-ribofuranosyl)aminobenzene 5'-phosphate synthase
MWKRFSQGAALFAAAAMVAAGQQNSISNLYDAFGLDKKGTVLDWGYSALIHYHSKTILFDAGGHADMFAQNVKAFGTDLKKVDFAMLSHKHGDHASGFDYVLTVNPKLKLYLPNDSALGGGTGLALPKVSQELREALRPEELYFKGEERAFGGAWGPRFWHANSEMITASREIGPGLTLITTRSPMIGDFSRYPPNDAQPALNGTPELSLAMMTSRGVVLVTGCSHSRVEAIVAETKKVTQKNIYLVIGGFHLLPYEAAEITRLAKLMKDDLGVENVAPAHCTGPLGFKIFKDVYGAKDSYAGLGSTVNFPD